MQYLRSIGVQEVRLRWPNDLIIGSKKVAGLLIEHPATEKMIVGFGLNVTNSPWEEIPALRETATRLCDWMSPPPLDEIALGVLDAMASAHTLMSRCGMGHAIEELNRHWSEARAVELLLTNGDRISGAFLGLDAAGHLRLRDKEGREFVVEHPLIERLTEFSPRLGSNFWTNRS